MPQDSHQSDVAAVTVPGSIVQATIEGALAHGAQFDEAELDWTDEDAMTIAFVYSLGWLRASLALATGTPPGRGAHDA